MAFIEPMHRNKPNITYLLGAEPNWHEKNNCCVAFDFIHKCGIL